MLVQEVLTKKGPLTSGWHKVWPAASNLQCLRWLHRRDLYLSIRPLVTEPGNQDQAGSYGLRGFGVR